MEHQTQPKPFYKSVEVANQIINDLFLHMIPTNLGEYGTYIVLGQNIKFANDRNLYTVRAITEKYIICTSKSYVTILDLERNIRADRTSWILGYDTDIEVHLGMLALYGRHPEDIDEELSNRRKEPLIFDELRCFRTFVLEWKSDNIDLGGIQLENWTASNNMNICIGRNEKYDVYENTNVPNLMPLSSHKTLEDAKAAAQKYFNKNRKKFSSLNWKSEKFAA